MSKLRIVKKFVVRSFKGKSSRYSLTNVRHRSPVEVKAPPDGKISKQLWYADRTEKEH
jgi:hypothetical protein